MESNEINDRTKKKEKRKIPDRIERVLKWSFLSVFSILVLTQAILTDPSISSYFNKDTADGSPLGIETYLYERCKMELKLNNAQTCPELIVMVNGDEVGGFSSDTMMLDLKDGDVVELDASRLILSADVQISAVSSNKEELLGRSFNVTGGIVQIAVI